MGTFSDGANSFALAFGARRKQIEEEKKMKSNKTIYVDSNGNVAEPTNPAITYRLVVVAGGEISDVDMVKYKLTAADVSDGVKAEEPVASVSQVGVIAKPEEKEVVLGKPKAK